MAKLSFSFFVVCVLIFNVTAQQGMGGMGDRSTRPRLTRGTQGGTRVRPTDENGNPVTGTRPRPTDENGNPATKPRPTDENGNPMTRSTRSGSTLRVTSASLGVSVSIDQVSSTVKSFSKTSSPVFVPNSAATSMPSSFPTPAPNIVSSSQAFSVEITSTASSGILENKKQHNDSASLSTTSIALILVVVVIVVALFIGSVWFLALRKKPTSKSNLPTKAFDNPLYETAVEDNTDQQNDDGYLEVPDVNSQC